MSQTFRKYIIIFMLALIYLQSSGQDLTPEERFSTGTAEFASGNYQKALDIWTGLYDAGYRSAELEYNIGNASFKMNDIPGSVLFFERAHKLAPADEDINYNLEIARTLVVDRFEEIPELFFVRWFDFLSLLLATNTWAMISIITFVLCLALLSVYLYSSKYKFKVAGFWLALTLFIISASSLALTIRNKNLVYDSHQAVIFSPQVSGKSSPDGSGTDLFLLHEGTKVSVEDKVGEWLEIRLSDGNKGWVPADCLKII